MLINNLFKIAFIINGTMVVILVPISVFGSMISLMNFILIKQWKNPSRHYYYIIAGLNLLQSIVYDSIKFATSTLLGISSAWFGSPIKIAPQNLNDVFCSSINYGIDTFDLMIRWAIAIFTLHRLLIVCYSLKV